MGGEGGSSSWRSSTSPFAWKASWHSKCERLDCELFYFCRKLCLSSVRGGNRLWFASGKQIGKARAGGNKRSNRKRGIFVDPTPSHVENHARYLWILAQVLLAL